MNNGKYQSEQYLRLQAEKNDRRFGPIREHQKTCQTCAKPFVWSGREKTKAFSEAKFCCRACSNSVGGQALSLIREETGVAHYRTICMKYHNFKCVVCNEERIVEVHHLNEDHEDNRPANLIPLCPTHHQYVHSKYRHLVMPIIEAYTIDWGISSAGRAAALLSAL
jgi:hypothetical protein